MCRYLNVGDNIHREIYMGKRYQCESIFIETTPLSCWTVDILGTVQVQDGKYWRPRPRHCEHIRNIDPFTLPTVMEDFLLLEY